MTRADPCPPAAPARAALEADQLAKLRALLRALVPGNVFQSPRLRATGVSGELAGLDEFIQRVPFTTKRELVDDQLAHPPFGTNHTYPLDRYTRFTQTSGTTAAPLRWLDTPESWAWMTDNWSVVFEAAGVRPGDRVYFAFSFGPFLGFWTAFDAATRLGCLCLPGGGLTSAARLRAILDNQATVLLCTPTYALRLAETAAEEGICLASAAVRTIIAAGEAGASIPATRARLGALWHGARVFDHHGMTEVGPVSFACPARPGVLHVIESSYLAEVIDPQTGAPIGPGGAGELVLTTLGRAAAPVLRYRTGDLVRRAAPPPPEGICACGRCDLALEGGILGRADDMIVVRGVNVYPSAVEDVVRSVAGIAEYRAEVHQGDGRTELRLLVEPATDCRQPAALPARLEGALRTALNLRVPVALTAPGTLPRWDMKAKRWVNV